MQEQIKDSNIFTVDALYVEPQLAAIHILRENDRLALIDTGTQYSVTQVADALLEMELSFDHVELIILTHIHLDHAGGAGALMQRCKNAQLVVHPKGERHMVDPGKLIAGASAVYGEVKFKEMYGAIAPIDAQRIIVPEDGDHVSLGDRKLLFVDTPGHANHHHCIFDQQTNSVFTGDTLGIAYPALREPKHVFVLPTTTPVQFNPEALHQSIDKVMSLQPDTLYCTHYGALQPNAQNIAGLHEQIDDFVLLTQQVAEHNHDDFEAHLHEQLLEYLVRRARNELPSVSESTIRHWLSMDAKLNAQGLAFWWRHRRFKMMDSDK